MCAGTDSDLKYSGGTVGYSHSALHVCARRSTLTGTSGATTLSLESTIVRFGNTATAAASTAPSTASATRADHLNRQGRPAGNLHLGEWLRLVEQTRPRFLSRESDTNRNQRERGTRRHHSRRTPKQTHFPHPFIHIDFQYVATRPG